MQTCMQMCSVLGWNFEQKNDCNPERDSKNTSKDDAEWTVGGKLHYTMAKPPEDDVKKGHFVPLGGQPNDRGH